MDKETLERQMLKINDVMSKWPNVTDMVLAFYDAINKEPTRNRKLFQFHLEKIFEAVEKDLQIRKRGW